MQRPLSIDGKVCGSDKVGAKPDFTTAATKKVSSGVLKL
jgi:hypothetical protein